MRGPHKARGGTQCVWLRDTTALKNAPPRSSKSLLNAARCQALY